MFGDGFSNACHGEGQGGWGRTGAWVDDGALPRWGGKPSFPHGARVSIAVHFSAHVAVFWEFVHKALGARGGGCTRHAPDARRGAVVIPIMDMYGPRSRSLPRATTRKVAASALAFGAAVCLWTGGVPIAARLLSAETPFGTSCKSRRGDDAFQQSKAS